MYVRDLIVGLFRRWYLVLAGVLATAGLAVGVLSVVPASYHADASVLLLPPRTSLGKGGNQFLYLGGLNQAMGVLSSRLNAEDFRAHLEDQYAGSTLEIAPDLTTTGPILAFRSTTTDPQQALLLTQSAVAAAGPALQSLQDNLQIPASSRITLMTLTLDAQPTQDVKNQLRAVVAVAVIGLGGTLLATAMVDGWLLGRRRPRVLDLRWWRRTGRSGEDDWNWWAEEQARRDARAPAGADDVEPDPRAPTARDVVVGDRQG